ncbi:Signal transduction histidine kinase [Aeromicrobium choanae]|uniref:histidine kinase n=1 Tax=Aeromicrobium choanae TaxID=1736691 RepID=A0A1T4YP07_9ACTN|nr:Signal transduction histidine kinase [Aeromicrobium choanae]
MRRGSRPTYPEAVTPPPPPLTVWGHTWRTVLVISISAVAWSPVFLWQWENARWWWWLDLTVGLASFVLVFWRRRYPVTVGVITNLSSAFATTAGGPATLALFSLSTRRRWREIIPVSAATLVGAFIFVGIDPTTDPGLRLFSAGFVVAIVGVTVGWGMYVGSRRELLATLKERAERAESEQAARVSQARTAERARIAREMHDVLAHRISMVTMHAGALTFRDDLAAEEIKRTASVIEQTSRLALIELREVLGVLRDDVGDGAPEPPQPTAGAIAGLVAQFRESGMNLQYDDRIDPATIPDLIGRTAYRVVQEGLTNASKHAPHARVTLLVTGGSDDGLVIEVSNPLPAGGRSPDFPASGLGLVGLTERAELAGGRLHHGMVSGHHVLRVWLPWSA